MNLLPVPVCRSAVSASPEARSPFRNLEIVRSLNTLGKEEGEVILPAGDRFCLTAATVKSYLREASDLVSLIAGVNYRIEG